MDADDLVTIYTMTDSNKAEIVKVALEGEGVRCELGGDGQAGFTGLWEIDVMVRAEDADRARKIVESHE